MPCFAVQALAPVRVLVADIYIPVRSLKPQWYILQTERLVSSLQTLPPLLCSAGDSVVRAVNY